MGEIADKFVTDFLGALPPEWSSNLADRCRGGRISKKASGLATIYRSQN